MDDGVNTEPEIFIFKDQQRAFALDNNDVSAETCLRKGDAATLLATTDDVSEMMDCTRKSKAKVHTDSAVKVVAV